MLHGNGKQHNLLCDGTPYSMQLEKGIDGGELWYPRDGHLLRLVTTMVAGNKKRGWLADNNGGAKFMAGNVS